MAVNLLFVVLFASVAYGGKHDIYSGHTVHGIVIKQFSDLEIVHELEVPLELDIWQHGYPGERDIILMVSSENSRTLLDVLDKNGIEHYLKIRNLPQTLEEFDNTLARYQNDLARKSRQAIPFENFPRYDQINQYLFDIAAQYPDLVTLVKAGQSFEGRDIYNLKISTTNFTDASKPVYVMDALIHAREWVTAPVALYAIHRLVVDLREGDRDLLEGTDWIIHPIVNPDGYEYTHNTERLWRKTRSINQYLETDCLGVDGNRNFDSNHSTVGIDLDPCSITYPGEIPFSEPETGYIRDILMEHLDRVMVYLNMHSYGNLILFAYGDGNLPANAMQIHHVGATMGSAIDAVKLPKAKFYLVGNSRFVLYWSSGTARDYGSHIGVPFSYTLELPGYEYDFIVPPEYIAQINEETWRGIGAQARLAKLHYNQKLMDQTPPNTPFKTGL